MAGKDRRCTEFMIGLSSGRLWVFPLGLCRMTSLQERGWRYLLGCVCLSEVVEAVS